MRRYQIPPCDASDLLEETVLELIYLGVRADDPAQWLEATVRNKCRKYWLTQRRQVADAIGRVFSGA